MVFQENRNKKYASIAILISDKVDFKPKLIEELAHAPIPNPDANSS